MEQLTDSAMEYTHGHVHEDIIPEIDLRLAAIREEEPTIIRCDVD